MDFPSRNIPSRKKDRFKTVEICRTPVYHGAEDAFLPI